MVNPILEEHYLDGSITHEELQTLREQLISESDESVGKRMQERWERYEYAGCSEKEEMDDLWERISSRACASEQKIPAAWKWLGAVAAIAIPLLLFTSIFFYHKSSVLSYPEIVMATGEGERASVTLPDGTFVNLNENTTLRYDSKHFNKSNRTVYFDGEGYFEIAHDARHPFSIDADRLNITVLGTEFNLNARSAEGSSTLSLTEGKAAFTALSSGETIILSPNQEAMLEKATGKISVEEMGDDLQAVTAWRHKQIMFRDAAISDVLNTLEKTFNVKFDINGSIDMNDVFTGTMSAESLDIDLTILERLYHLKARRVGDTVTISKE